MIDATVGLALPVSDEPFCGIGVRPSDGAGSVAPPQLERETADDRPEDGREFARTSRACRTTVATSSVTVVVGPCSRRDWKWSQ
ncbi:hypothetical protein [Natrinema halophilum]|uniref:hypothetical protein n=1 Tax=Natrinema halophilum TaxID=1699371 RepID=UPI001F468955|nr:hypothetical protein [Natrinema halophilum]UHQ96074.1 hypothetical protein HYG82_22355 [Natrinema halophilum]